MNIGNGIGSTQQALSLLSTASTNGAAKAEELKQAAKSNDSTPVTDAAKLTSTAGLIFQAVAGPDDRAAHVQAIQQSIAAGTYNVPAAAVADKLMESMFG